MILPSPPTGGGGSFFLEASLSVKARPLGKTGLTVSEIGFGCWGIGGLVPGASYGETDDAESLRALERAVERGITFFDTAPAYGNGRSERLLGIAFGNRADVTIATKAGQDQFDLPIDFSAGAIRRSVEASLGRLKRERIDLLQLHNPTIDALKADPAILGTLDDLKREGKIREVGLSLKAPAEAVEAIRDLGARVVQVNFNLIDHRAIDSGLFDLVATSGAGLIARTPLAFGMLAGEAPQSQTFAPGDHRANWAKDRLALWATEGRAMASEIARRDGQPLPQVAIRFCLSYDAVSAVIPGMLTPAEVDENAKASAAGRLTSADLTKIRDQYAKSALSTPPPKKS